MRLKFFRQVIEKKTKLTFSVRSLKHIKKILNNYNNQKRL